MAYGPPVLRVHSLTFVIDRDAMLKLLDGRPEILNWFAYSPHALLVVSRHDAVYLADIFRKVWPGLFFVVAEIDRTKVDGYINQAVWTFINEPKPSGRWPSA
jgi:hypothetical protein